MRALTFFSAHRAAIALVALAGCTPGTQSGESADNSPGTSAQSPAAADPASPDDGALPGLRVVRQLGGVTRLYGATLATGESAVASAERFVQLRAPLIEARPDQLVRVPPRGAAADGARGLMYDRASGRYRMALVDFRQEQDGVPVFGAGLHVMVRQGGDYPAVMAKSTLRVVDGPLSHPGVEQVRPELANAAVAQVRGRTDLKGEPLVGAQPQLSAFHDRRPVIWAGVGAKHEAPRPAIEFVGDNGGGAGALRPERWRFVADAHTGEILHTEDLIRFDITGTVGGMATVGSDEMGCAVETRQPFVDANVSMLAGPSVTTDAGAAFAIPVADGGSHVIQSPVTGAHFQVVDASGGDEVLQSIVMEPGTADFVHNQANATEFVRAQANGYVHSNLARNWVFTHHPTYMFDQADFPVNVNSTTGQCPGNAWYDLFGLQMHFCRARDFPSPVDQDYGNTAFGDVIYHEYGHHIVNVAGSGQGAFGEGMGDVIAILMSDDPQMGLGFFLDECARPLRNADNGCQYVAGPACSSCGSEIHDCGNVLSGAVWDLREAIGLSDPGNALDIVSALALNAVLLHRGELIEPQIAIDYLLLDDDDDNIDNGTPHSDAICAAFGAHALPCPPFATGLSVSPGGDVVSGGTLGGPFSPGSAQFAVQNLGPGPLDYQVTVDQPWLMLTGAAGTLADGASAPLQAAVDAGAAAALGRGAHVATLTFTNTGSGVGNTTRTFTLTVGQEPIYDFPLDSDPGFSTTGGWAFGVPAGGGGATGGDAFGSPDPSAGFTGDNVYGYNLAGNYENDLPAQHLTTPALDFSDISNVRLSFKRWLCVETSVYDQASVSVSTDGNSFQPVWTHEQTLPGGSWVDQAFDLSAIADGQSTVYVRWTMGATDGGWNFCGWNVDDITLSGIDANGGCMVDANCDDGLACNGSETCDAGQCTRGNAMVCDDAVACTTDTCAEPAGTCVHTPDAAACDNGLFCDGAETCDPVGGCQPGAAPTVDDNVACTTDSCDEVRDVVWNTPDDDACDNGLFCDGAETCDLSQGCAAGAPPVVADGIACTVDACDEGGDRITHVANHGSCDNGQFCDGVERCDLALGCRPGQVPGLDDGVACTVDTCDENADTIAHVPNNGACNNGLYCDGIERCDVAVGCVAGAPVGCGDAVSCTIDSCNEGSDRCEHAPSDGACDNGLFCDGAETCDVNTGCVAGAAPGIDDGVACTDSICDEAGDRLVVVPVHGRCDNGVFCDGIERCDASAGCVAGAAPVLSDGIDCTVDRCDEAAGVVVHAPDDGVCDNGVFCDGLERCSAQTGCLPTEPHELSDGIDCTADSCDEAAGEIVHAADDSVCDNDLFCDGQERCDVDDGCVAGQDPCDDGDGCTEDRCDEEAGECGDSVEVDRCVPDAGGALRDGGTAGGDQDPLDGDGAEAPDGDASVDEVAVHRPACGCRTLGSPATTHAMRSSGRFPGWLLMLSGLSLVAVRIRIRIRIRRV